MPPTPWTTKASSLPSDRIPAKSRHQPSPTKSQSSASPGNLKPVKSKVLRELESLLVAVQNESGSTIPDPKGGCFCQARMHPLSTYVPMCPNCALPLCNFNPPNNACPHCTSSLFSSPSHRAKAIVRIQDQIHDTLSREEAERIQVEEVARKAAGAFPALLSSSNSQPHSTPPRTQAPPQAQQHKVLSLNSKTKRAVLMTTTTTPRPSPPASTTPSRPASPPVVRIPPPLGADVLFARETVRPDRPWENLILRREGQEYIYVPLPTAKTLPMSKKPQTSMKSEKAKEKGKGKARGNNDSEAAAQVG